MEIMDKKKRDKLMAKLYSVCPIRISITIGKIAKLQVVPELSYAVSHLKPFYC